MSSKDLFKEVLIQATFLYFLSPCLLETFVCSDTLQQLCFVTDNYHIMKNKSQLIKLKTNTC